MLHVHFVALLSLLLQSAPAEPSSKIQESALRAHVEKLASPEFEGRGDGAGKDKARQYLISEFTKIGLKPAGSLKSFVYDFKEPAIGQDLVGVLPGSDPKLAAQFIVISAHYDHLGKKGETIYPGADDDATGVAAVLEMARALKANPKVCKRSVLIVLFDLEEKGLLGSAAFVKSPPIALESIALFTTMDMLGRNAYDILENYLFVLGAEFIPSTKDMIKKAFEGSGFKPGLVGTDLIGARSDYGPFAEHKIPYWFFGTGEHADYHKPTDTADRVLYPKLTKNVQIILRAVIAAANAPARPVWSEPKPDLDEVRAIGDFVAKAKDKGKDMGLGEMELKMLENESGQIDGILKRGAVTKEEREQLKMFIQTMLSQLGGK